MGHDYRAVGWNRQKRVYDTVVGVAIASYLVVFVGVGLAFFPSATAETLLIRSLGTGAWLLLHVVLVIGPLCRLRPGFLPLLYNRRHLGVSMFLLALAHGLFSLLQYHALGPINPLLSVLTSDGGFDGAGRVPFHVFGVAALVILFLMAATSHDFWLRNLTARTWKSLHMAVYVAYVLLVAHIAFGILQQERSLVWVAVVVSGVLIVGSLHVVAGLRERKRDRTVPGEDDGFVDVCAVADLPETRGRTFVVAGDRVAVFRYDGRVSAVSNACQHQNGPLGEGRIIDGCIVCPWHGYQYDPATGASPPPFTEKVPPFEVRIRDGRVLIASTPHPAGTRIEPARL